LLKQLLSTPVVEHVFSLLALARASKLMGDSVYHFNLDEIVSLTLKHLSQNA